MPVTLAFRFPLGGYHANPWDRAVNEGASEWPPSPWRILRTLVATWHTRWPELAASEFDALLGALADPPCYGTPPVGTGHTRHYLPDLDHRKAETGHTDLTLDPFLTVSRESELLVRWNAELTSGQRETLAKLAELIPYLGRSESACYARLLGPDEDAPVPDESWWCPGLGTDTAPDGTAGSVRRTRLLSPVRPFDRAVLEATTASVRKQKRTVPPGTEWVTYTVISQAGTSSHRRSPAPRRRAVPHLPTTIRFAVTGRAPVRIANGILIADEAHRIAGKRLEEARVPDGRRQQILGTGGAKTDHAHAHWIPVAGQGESAGAVRYLLIYVCGGLESNEIAALLSIGKLSGKRGEAGYEVRGFPEQTLLFQAAGQIEDVEPELAPRPGAVHWRSVTPYLPVRHRHKETAGEHVTADISRELRYHNLPEPVAVTAAEPLTGRVNQFRRYRIGERLHASRAGVGLRLTFAAPVEGPVLLGQLSHFGFGIFAPEHADSALPY